MATIEELLALREELASKEAKVKELEDTMAQLQEELARLKGEAPPIYTCPYCGATFGSQADLNDHIASVHPTEPPIAALPKKVWYKRWTTWLLLGGLGTLITGIAIKKRKKE